MSSSYSNAFNIAINEDKTEIVIAFLKNSPKINEDGDFENEIFCENVSTIIMNIDSARKLVEATYQLMSDETSEEEEKNND